MTGKEFKDKYVPIFKREKVPFKIVVFCYRGDILRDAILDVEEVKDEEFNSCIEEVESFFNYCEQYWAKDDAAIPVYRDWFERVKNRTI